MEFIYVFLFSVVVVSFSFLVVRFKYKSSDNINVCSGSGGGSLPPGQFGWPVFGESLAFLRTGWNGEPEKFIFDRINKYSSYIFKTCLLGQKTVVFCGPMANKFVFSNENKLFKLWWPDSANKIFQPTDQSKKPEGSLKLNKFIQTVLRTEALNQSQYIGVMDRIAQRHFKNHWENNSQVVVFPLTKKLTFLIACKVFLSVEDPEHVEKLAKPFTHILSGIFSIPINVPGSQFNRAIKASNLVRKMIMDMAKQKRNDLAAGKVTPTQDILSRMVSETDENGNFMDDIDIANMIIGLLVAGHDSTSSVCSSIVKYLAELPHIYDQVYKEQIEIAKSKSPGEFLSWEDIQKMKYSWNVACEALRIATPIQGNFREVIADFVFNGFTIPKGWKIYWSTNSTHKNPEFYSNPQKFDPSRFEGTRPTPYTYVPFGGGLRMCPGREYARLKILVFMHNLVKRFKFEKIIPEEKNVVDPTPIPAMGLPVYLYPLHS